MSHKDELIKLFKSLGKEVDVSFNGEDVKITVSGKLFTAKKKIKPLTVSNLKEFLNDYPDDMEVRIGGDFLHKKNGFSTLGVECLSETEILFKSEGRPRDILVIKPLYESFGDDEGKE